MEDLWKATFPAGTSWDQFDSVYNKFPWDLSNLEQAFEDKGNLNHVVFGTNNEVYLFGTTELRNVTSIPVAVAIVSPSPPSSELCFKEQNSQSLPSGERIKIPTKKLKMDWIPYNPLDKRGIQVERVIKTCPIFVLGCTQRKRDRVMQFQYAVPCLDDRTVEVECDEVDTKLDWLQEFMLDKLMVDDECLSEGTKDFLMRLVRSEPCEARKDANRKKIRAGFEDMRIYKFYPVQTPFAIQKSRYINFYLQIAHEVL